MRDNIEKLLFSSNFSGYKISKETGIPQSTISRFLTRETDISSMRLGTAEILNDYYNKKKEEMILTNIGTWWNDKNIELVGIDGVVYALNGWNGESYQNCWKCIGDDNMDASEDEYIITPQYKKVAEDEYEVIDYEVRK